MELPSGTITFLMTDVEGSTRLWEQHAAAMEAALTRHDAIATSTIAQHNGALVKSQGEGDSLFASFGRPADALRAALSLQQAFCSEPWPADALLRVRMALNTGPAEFRDGDYFGPTVNRCARIRAIAHGGQVLLSFATQEQLCGELPPGASLRDMGSHRLKDLQQPEHVFELMQPDLPVDFPPLRSLQAFANNLPVQSTSFVGREREIAEVRQLLEATRLLSLAGPGGSGKTRLALHVAADEVEAYPDGVWFVQLESLADPALVAQAVASALGVREEAGRPLVETLGEYLYARRLLLLLDNSEHLLDACALFADHLIRSCPHVRILVTSREPLGIAGETVYRVPTLTVPEPDGQLEPDSLSRYEAVRLFCDRAAAVAPSFHISGANAPAVAQVCRRLDGIPLALELAAARVRALPVEQIAARLDDRFHLLTGGSRAALPRQRTLEGLIDWSYNLLHEEERQLLLRLSVFSGGWTLDAAEAVCSDPDARASDARLHGRALIRAWQVLDLLTSLVDKSLAVFDEQSGRYRMLETIRQYSAARLSPEEGLAARNRHLWYCMDLAEQAEPKLEGSVGRTWASRMRQELDNLRSALSWSLDSTERVTMGMRMAGAMHLFWLEHGLAGEGTMWLGRLLAHPGALTRTPARGKALYAAASLGMWAMGMEQTRAWLEESVSICQEAHDMPGVARAVAQIGWGTCFVGDLREARGILEQSVALYRPLDDVSGLAYALKNLGIVALFQSDFAASERYLVESLELSREIGFDRCVCGASIFLGLSALHQGRIADAVSQFDAAWMLLEGVPDQQLKAICLGFSGLAYQLAGQSESVVEALSRALEIAQETGDNIVIAAISCYGGNAAQVRGDRAFARAWFARALAVGRDIGYRYALAVALDGFATLAASAGELQRSARLLGAVERLRQGIGAPRPPLHDEPYQAAVTALRAALGETGLEAEWARGCSMTMEQAVTYALEGAAPG